MTFHTYVKLSSAVTPEAVEEKFPAYLQHRINDKWEGAGWHYGLELQPIQKIHLSTGYQDENATTRSKGYLVILGTIAFIILLLAVINYVNLTSALANINLTSYLMNRDVGFHKDDIVSLFSDRGLAYEEAQRLKEN